MAKAGEKDPTNTPGLGGKGGQPRPLLREERVRESGSQYSRFLVTQRWRRISSGEEKERREGNGDGGNGGGEKEE